MAEDYYGGYDLTDFGEVISHETWPRYIHLQGYWYRQEEEDGPLYVMHPGEVMDLMKELQKE